MVLVLTSQSDIASGQVIAWLNHYGTQWFRLNDYINEQGKATDFTFLLREGDPNFTVTHQGAAPVDLSAVHIVWFRRIQIGPKINHNSDELLNTIGQHLNRVKTNEKDAFMKAFFKSLRRKKWLSHPETADLNKCYQLFVAKGLGIDVPDTLITTSKKELIAFRAKYKLVATKALQTIPPMAVNQFSTSFLMYANILVDKEVDELPDMFFPSIFQAYIQKEFEIRAFYLAGKFYSCAMFTQANPQTVVDFRRYDYRNPARRVPYQLPKNVEDQFSKLMDELDLNTGSLDIIYRDDRYYFLEVNPVGQFGFISHPCNYLIEQQIARYLMENNTR